MMPQSRLEALTQLHDIQVQEEDIQLEDAACQVHQSYSGVGGRAGSIGEDLDLSPVVRIWTPFVKMKP